MHNIVAAEDNIISIYDLSIAQMESAIAAVDEAVAKGEVDDFSLYFDDSYASFIHLILQQNTMLALPANSVHVAVIPELLNRHNRMTDTQIKEVSRSGYRVDSHGYSHSALAVFNQGKLQTNTTKGSYTNTPYGQGEALSVQEVDFQLQESAKYLGQLIGNVQMEFVLPYGLYNDQVISQINNSTNYTRIMTCHSAIDVGNELAPRHLLTQENLGSLRGDLQSLPDYFDTLK